MRRSRRYSPVDIGWKWAAIALAILSAIGILAVAVIGMFVVTKVDQIPGFERLVVTGKYRRPVDGVVKAVENLIPSRPPSVDGNGVVDVYQLQVKSKEIARIDDELVFFEKNFLTLPKNELNARRNWHDAKFLSKPMTTGPTSRSLFVGPVVIGFDKRKVGVLSSRMNTDLRACVVLI